MNVKVLSICFSGSRNAMGDSYKNIMNAFVEKKTIACVIPGAYQKEEFSNDFAGKIKENISLRCGGNKFIRKAKKVFLILEFAKEIKDYIKEKQIEKIFVYSENHFFYFLMYWVLLYMNIKCICWVHDPVLHLGESKVVILIRKLNSLFFYRKVSKFIVSYQEGINEMVEIYGIKKDRIEVVRLPRMPEMEFSEIKQEQYSLKYDFIFWGRIEEYKGLDLLIEVFGDESLKNVKLLIVGQGKLNHEINNQVKGIENILFINKYLSNQELAQKIMESKYVILPYKSATGSQVIQIANFYGKLVLATRVGCFPEYIENHKNGILIDAYTYASIKEAILYMMQQDLKKYDVSIKDKLDEFDINYTANKIWRIIDE